VQEDTYVLHNASEQVMFTMTQGITVKDETGLSENQQVSRHVHGINTMGLGAASATLTKYTLIHDPLNSDFTVAAASGNQVNVTITAPPANPTAPNTGVWIERLTDNVAVSGQWFISSATNPTWVFSDTSVLSNTTYYYRFSYRNGDAVTGLYSNVKSVTTPAVLPWLRAWSGPRTARAPSVVALERLG